MGKMEGGKRKDKRGEGRRRGEGVNSKNGFYDMKLLWENEL